MVNTYKQLAQSLVYKQTWPREVVVFRNTEEKFLLMLLIKLSINGNRI